MSTIGTHCARCGEYYPCSDSKRTDIAPDERAKHVARVTAVDYIRDDMARCVRQCERYAQEQGIELIRDHNYPRFPLDGYSTDRLKWHAWMVDAMLNFASALLVATDTARDSVVRREEMLYALRCSWQITEYRGRANGTTPWAYFSDHAIACRNAMEYLIRKVDLGKVDAGSY